MQFGLFTSLTGLTWEQLHDLWNHVEATVLADLVVIRIVVAANHHVRSVCGRYRRAMKTSSIPICVIR